MGGMLLQKYIKCGACWECGGWSDTEQRTGGGSLQALETKFSSYLWASVFLHGQQCWNVPRTGQANPELDYWVYQDLLEAYHLRWATTRVTDVGTSKESCSLTCFAESCTTEATFLLCLLKKPVYPHPSTTASQYYDNPGDNILFSRGGPEAPLFSNKIYIIGIPGTSK